jgi:pSer/pThr/pTyr-binding forkhead associated (FHA) protein
MIQDLGIGENGKNANNDHIKTSRKIIGWIISYSHDLMGMDFRLYEGNNSIGRDAENSITIKNDGGISGTHVIILYRLNKCYIRDEMASNGTFINGNLIEVGQSHELHDGDLIGLGSTTTFRYRSAL